MGVLAALALGAAAPSAGTPVDLGSLIAFAGPRDCEAAPAFERMQQSLFTGLTTRDLRLGQVDVPARYAPAMGRPWLGRRVGATIVTLPLAGEWHDLKLVALIMVAPSRGQPLGFVLRFGETRTDVIRALNRLGLDIPASGARSERADEDNYTLSVGVRAIGRQTDFSCGWN
jgi:hypothetical protein